VKDGEEMIGIKASEGGRSWGKNFLFWTLKRERSSGVSQV